MDKAFCCGKSRGITNIFPRGITNAFSGYHEQKFGISLMIQSFPVLKLLNSLSTRESFLKRRIIHRACVYSCRKGNRAALRAGVLFEEGCAPSCREVYLRVLTCQKWVRYFLPRKGQKIFRSRAKRRVLTGSGRSDKSCLCRDGTRNGLSGPNKERAGFLRQGRKRLGRGSKGRFHG
jgi:hypothetical protein